MPTTARLVHTTGMRRSPGGAQKARGAETTPGARQLSAQLQAEARAREAAEAQLRRARKMGALGQLTGGVAHDLANVLTAIMGSLEIAQRDKVDAMASFQASRPASACGASMRWLMPGRLGSGSRPHSFAVLHRRALPADPD